MSERTALLRVELSGGLANQLFQWAAGEILASEFDLMPVYESREVDRPDGYGRGQQITGLINGLSIRSPSAFTRSAWLIARRLTGPTAVGGLKRISRLIHSMPVPAPDYETARQRLRTGKRVRLRGLFQEVRELERCKESLSSRIELAEKELPGNYAVVHVRRGDYVANPKYAALFGSCSEEYYRRAIEELDSQLPLKFVSDDPEWCRNFIEQNSLSHAEVVGGEGRTHFDDLALIAHATEIAISNSTFSWWGAFLSSARLVISPTPWFNDQSHDRQLALAAWVQVSRV